MKNLSRIFLLALLQAGVIMAMPLLVPEGSTRAGEEPPRAEAMAMSGTAEPAPSPEAEALDEAAELEVLAGGESVKMKLSDYLFGVVAAEMPASFEPEALAAQAVAARTYAVYKMNAGTHGGAVCTDAACCQAWQSEQALREKWGADYEAYAQKLRAAVAETDGLCVSFDGQAALTAFHACSGGFTESSENVFGTALPYLVSVESMEKPEEVPNYISSVTLDEEALYAAVAAWDADAAVNASNGALLADAVYSTTGRLLKVRLGGEEISGSELRKIFSLRSALVSWRREDGGVSFTVTGYGHGVGMSQYGANAMAESGSGFREILSHFYPGTSVTPLSALAAGAAML